MRDYSKVTDRSQIARAEQPEWDRNIAIARKNLLEHKSYTVLSREYNLSATRIGAIVKTWKSYILAEKGGK